MTIRRPNVTGSLRPAGTTVGIASEAVLVVGQKNGGTAASGALVENILNDNGWDTLFGKNSPISAAIRRFRRRNGETRLDAIALDDNGNNKATGGFNITGSATEAGTLTFYAGSKKFNKYIVPVASGATADTIGAALEALIADDSKALVDGANTSGNVELTAINAGLVGNGIGLRVDGAVGGVSIQINQMSGGAADPVLTGIFDAIGEKRYQTIIWQFDDLTEVKDLLDSRFNVNNNILDGRAFYGKTDTLANHLTDLGLLNSNSISYMTDNLVNKDSHKGPSILDLPFVKAAEFAAIRALRRTDGAVLGSNVTARSAGDAYGGINLNSKPYFNTELPDLLPIDAADTLTETEMKQIVDAGGWVAGNNTAGNAIITGEVTTTYKTDAAGNEDITWSYLNYVDTATACREYIVNNTRAKYVQYRATGGALTPGAGDSANEASVAAFVIEKISELGDLNLLNKGVGTIDGEPVDYDKEHRENLTVTLNPATGAFAVSAKLHNVVQVRGILYDFASAFEI